MNYKCYYIFSIVILKWFFVHCCILYFNFTLIRSEGQAETCQEGGLEQDWCDVAQCIRVQMKEESCPEILPGLKQSRKGWQMKRSKILKLRNVRSQISRPMCKGALFWTFFTGPTSKQSDSFIRILCENSISNQYSYIRLHFASIACEDIALHFHLIMTIKTLVCLLSIPIEVRYFVSRTNRNSDHQRPIIGKSCDTSDQ